MDLKKLFGISSEKVPLRLHNTYSGVEEIFVGQPAHPHEVTMYNCGPTVYDYPHIGNLRSYVFADTLKRALVYNGYKVKQVVNITDVGHLVSDGDDGEDKMTKALKREGKPLTLESMHEVANFYEEAFKHDLTALNIDTSSIIFPRASEHIPEQLAMIEQLEKKGFAYKTSDGMYFATAKFPDYGSLGNMKREGVTQASDEHARIAQNSEKKNFRDFALWKFNPALGWDSPWGKGFPGWHIECSAMSIKYLGEPIDIHTGGMDHIPIHHNNELAQAEAASGKKPFVRYWLHNEFIRLGNDKMSKSAGTFIRLQDLVEKKITPLAYRYWLLTSIYRTPTTLSFEALHGAQKGYEHLVRNVAELQKTHTDGTNKENKELAAAKERFLRAINDDLNTPSALAVLWYVLGSRDISSKAKLETLAHFDTALGLDLMKQSQSVGKAAAVPKNVQDLFELREEARSAKDWKKADELRAEISKAGWDILDSESGSKLSPR